MAAALGWRALPSGAPGGSGAAVADRSGAPSGAVAAGSGTGGPGSPPASGAGGAGGPVTGEVAPARAGAVVEDVAAVGTLRATESVMLRPEVAGRVVRIGFADGQRVARGTVLVALDASVPEAELAQVQAERALAKAKLDRAVELFEKRFVSAQARDDAAAALEVVDARLRLARARLDRNRVVAPFDGIVGLRNVAPGDYVKEGADLVALEDTSSMKVDLRLPERVIGRLRTGQPLDVVVDALPGRSFAARIDALDAQVDANGRSIVVRARIPNADGVLRGGMFARARVVLGTRDDAVTVPEEALVPQGQDLVLWKVVDGRARKVPVVAGVRRDARVEIREGVAAGDVIVTAGQVRLQKDGTPVRVAGAGTVASAPAASAPGGR